MDRLPAHLSEILPVPERTPDVLRTLLTGLPVPPLASDEGPDTWSMEELLPELSRLREGNLTSRAVLDLAHRGQIARSKWLNSSGRPLYSRPSATRGNASIWRA